MSTKVTTLTDMNISALRKATEETTMELAALTKTTATFHGDPEVSVKELDMAIYQLGSRYGRRGYPVQALHAVRRKLARQIQN